MAESRPITRSVMAKTKYEMDEAKRNGHPLSEKQIVEKWIRVQAFEEALDMLGHNSAEQHWVFCKRGQIQLNMKHLRQGFRSFQKAFNFRRKGCSECLEQLIKMIEKGQNQREVVEQLFSIAAEKEELPPHIKEQLQAKRHSVTPKYQVDGELDPVFQDMLEYYQEVGGKFKKLEVKEIEKDFRIAVAKNSIKPYQTIISIPEEHIIILEKVKKDPQIRLLHLQDNRLKSPKHTMLSVYILNQIQLGQQSPYYTYLKCLPKQIKNFPVKYPKHLLAELEGTSFIQALESRKEDLKEDYNTMREILENKPHITQQRFIWARMLVSSRIFGIIVHGVKTDALVPIADMLNHKIPKMTTWSFCDDKNSFIVQNLDQMILEGEEIFDSYGSKCNSRFLLNYGFVQPNNLSNEVFMSFKPYKGKIDAPCQRITLQLMTDEFRHVLSYYRQAIKEANNPTTKKKDFDFGRGSQSFVSNQNQLQTWKWIKASFKERLRKYKTTIKSDQKLLQQETQLSFNYRNCIEVRLGEKKILYFYVQMAKRMIEHFGGKRELDMQEMIYEPYLAEIRGHHFSFRPL